VCDVDVRGGRLRAIGKEEEEVMEMAVMERER